jgi:NitT/TauT family transport system substrate-binding protein
VLRRARLAARHRVVVARWAIPIALLGLIASGCTSEPRPAVQIAVAASPATEVLELAADQGLFAAEGVDVRLIEHTSSGDVLRAFERGQVDGMLTSVVEVLHARDAGERSPRVVLVTDAAGVTGSLVARPSLASVEELRGQRVAAEPRSLSLYRLLETLERHGLGLADVTLVPTDAMSMPRLLVEGSVDAAASYPPWTQHIVRTGVGQRLELQRPPSPAVEVLAFDRRVLDERPADVAAIVRTWDRALAELSAKPDDAIPAMAARERLTPREFAPLLERARLLRSDEQQSWLASDGILSRAVGDVSRLLRDNGQLTGPNHEEPLAQSPAAGAGSG